MEPMYQVCKEALEAGKCRTQVQQKATHIREFCLFESSASDLVYLLVGSLLCLATYCISDCTSLSFFKQVVT